MIFFLLYLYGVLAFAVLAYMTLWFFVGLALKRTDVAGVAWGLGFVLVAFLSYPVSFSERGLLATLLVSVWGIRLAFRAYASSRTQKEGRHEEQRYAALRQKWGKWFAIRSYFQIYVAQGLLLLLVAEPVVISNVLSSASARGGMLNLLDVAGLAVWMIGFSLDTPHRPNRSGQPDQSNQLGQLGEAVQWIGLWIIALSVPFGWIGVVGPLLILLSFLDFRLKK